MPHVQHSFRLDADLSDRFVLVASRAKVSKVEAFRQAIRKWVEDEAERLDQDEGAG
jgi:predicted transcriptional regulator